MPNSCVVPGCKSGYGTGQSKPDFTLSFHKFPDDNAMRRQWLSAIHRDTVNWQPSVYSRVCSLHFHEGDYTDSRDSNIHRKRKRTNTRKSLRKEAIPSVFPNLPTYLSSQPPQERLTAATTSERLAKQQEVLDNEVQAFFEADTISSLDYLKGRLYEINLPAGTDVIVHEKSVLFVKFLEESKVLEILYSLQVLEDLTLHLTFCGEKFPDWKIRHLLEDRLTLSSIGNVVAFLKNRAEENMSENVLEECISRVCKKLLSHTEDDPALRKKFGFICEQLELAFKKPASRRFSQDLLACCALWENVSPALYRQMHAEGFLTVPSVRRLHQLSHALITETGLQPSSLAYLQARSKKLSEDQKLVVLMIDEIYCAQRLEYASGKMTGFKQGELSKTLLSYMIKSTCSAYADVVALCPMTNLDADKLETETTKVLQGLNDLGFEVLLLSADNATPNRKFFMRLGKGSLPTSIPNPVDTEKPLFLLFDAVHDFKNLYNNFQTRRTFECPSFEEGGPVLWPKFAHLEELYQTELGKPAKIAYKLSDKVLHPSTLEKTNVLLADSLFHDSTIGALEFYSSFNPTWKETALFLQIVRSWWNRANVKSQFLGDRKRDESRKPIYSTDDSNFKFLVQFSSWLDR